MKMTLENLRSYTVNTVYPFDVMNAVKSYFVGWQEGFEHIFIEVQSCNYMNLSQQDAIEIAEERMRELNRGQDNDSDLVITKSLID
tara:strand:+ start:1113 stop:1370 length:258 start_codon:yes stop_codon:yes gene_type:complete